MKKQGDVFLEKIYMKRKWIIFSFLVLFFLASGSTRRNPTVNCDLNWRSPYALSLYLNNSIWIYNGEKELVIISTPNSSFVKIVENGNPTDLGKCSKVNKFGIGYHQDSLNRAYPYLKIDNKTYDFIEINEDSFTLAKFDNGKPCTFIRKEKIMETKMGKYQYNEKIYFLYLTNQLGSIKDEETNETFQIVTLDSHRFRIEESIFSDIPLYCWWEDEEGNLILLSEGFDVSGMSNEEIFQTFPVIKLEKVD